ncbi:MAG TPA: 2OG-Fe(II) oxygenase [Rhizomicrobium sp.]|jgi:peroxiredoxin/predicted 2-oxoglutarate/Fe(II)-dependent dioxygenase YbiX|nr:2OG-Fe(II) oxygenase [Rhizomicrobium sp.]
MLTVGDPAPWFEARSPERPDYHLSQAAGRYIVLSFFGSAGRPEVQSMLAAFRSQDRMFNDGFAAFFGVSCDADDEKQKRISERLPGFHLFWDPDGKVPELYGLTGETDGKKAMRRVTYVLDSTLRVLGVFPMSEIPGHARAVMEFVAQLPAHPPLDERANMAAPVLVLPRVFEPEFCKLLISLYEKGNSAASGFMSTDIQTGKTVLKMDDSFKKRRDVQIEDETVRQQVNARLIRRLVPEVKKVFQFDATRIERYIVARYDANEGGFFRPHRDNTTKGTAHRRFAVTMNLNAEDYEGGELRFAEFDRRTYRAPTGGAVVFSCSLLHEATPVTKGTRYAFLPFLYDEPAAKIREENLGFLERPKTAAE